MLMFCIWGFIAGVSGASLAVWLISRHNQAEIARSEARVKEIMRSLEEKQRYDEAERMASIR
jgi:Na+/glutamate symporter